MSKDDKEILTLNKVIGTTPVNLDIGAVPTGMKRWITFVKPTNDHVGANKMFLCSGATATDAASGVRKDKQPLANRYDTIAYPDSPSPNSPMFSIAGGKYLTAFTDAGNMDLFVQYYDE